MGHVGSAPRVPVRAMGHVGATPKVPVRAMGHVGSAPRVRVRAVGLRAAFCDGWCDTVHSSDVLHLLSAPVHYSTDKHSPHLLVQSVSYPEWT